MRDLIMSDVSKLSRILKKLSLRNEINIEGKSVNEAGKELIFAIAENIHLAEKEIDDLFADLFDLKVKFSTMKLEESGELIEQLINADGFKYFFKLASRLTK